MLITELRKGQLVRVVKGRKVPRGTEGRLCWFGYGRYMDRKGDYPYMVGLKTKTGQVHYTNFKNVEFVKEEPAVLPFDYTGRTYPMVELP